MTEKIMDNILGFYASFNFGETDSELIRSYLWSENGLKNKLNFLKWQDFGTDLKLILFEFYVRPIPYERKNIKPIGSFRRKEQSVGIPIILDDQNFFRLKENERQLYFKNTILEKLELLTEKIKRNKLDTNISELKSKVEKTLKG
ncbi:hypothetical protein [Bizionia arctica]|uniref:Uncharacterized protein n=1 Tax=Bizionia arctica TaxID=1495645 RepID=A0A917GL48_9FLAO|nr:hypothetical protein [Bizionia arctica]GGG50783.1 hypothetical protein GCM10010976_22440 [Bizionia arctica]